MEANELNSINISFMATTATLSSSSCHLSTDPLFSCIITLYILFLLYFPLSLTLSLSPVIFLTSLLLLSLLRLGAIQKTQNPRTTENSESIVKDANFEDKAENFSLLRARLNTWVASFDPDPSLNFEASFVEWDVKAPLEVIYEAYEGEGEEEEDPNWMSSVPDPPGVQGLERYPSLSMYYPESDSDSSSDGGMWMNGGWDSPESLCFKWEEEDREGLLIEIALDSSKEKKGTDAVSGLDSCFHVEEDNLIEIDISLARKEDPFPSEE